MRQELVFIGQGLDQEKMIQNLNECLLSEEEVLKGKAYWSTLDDPFPYGKKYEGVKLMMKSKFSNELSDFADIYSDDIEIIGVDRPNFDQIQVLANEFIETKEDLKIQWVQATDDEDSTSNILPTSMNPNLGSMISDQIRESSEMLGELVV